MQSFYITELHHSYDKLLHTFAKLYVNIRIFKCCFIFAAIIFFESNRVAGAINTGCDWTGSGLSTVRTDRQVISVYLRCTAGRIVWKYPRGAIRVLLNKPPHLQDNYRACLKIYPHRLATKHVRIFLEAPKRLINLFSESVNRTPQFTQDVVKCFRSVNGQVALYVEADDSPFETVQADIKYNIEFINNKHYSLREIPNTGDLEKQMLINRNRHVIKQETSSTTNTPLPKSDTFWSKWPWNIPSSLRITDLMSIDNIGITTESTVVVMPIAKPLTKQRRYFLPDAIDENIIDSFGESYDICRPCTPMESAHAFCSSEMVTRGTIFGVQQRPNLATNEIFVNQTHLLRVNLIDLQSDPEKAQSLSTDSQTQIPGCGMISFHSPLHCLTAHESGEFVFIGRRRFEEMMVICAPSLKEWANTVNHLKQTGDEPCVLSYK